MHFFALKIILNFKVHIEFLDAGDVIKIEGPPTDADKSREILEEQAKELMTKMDFTEINVDAKYHKHIIGKGGSTGNELMNFFTFFRPLGYFERLSINFKIKPSL